MLNFKKILNIIYELISHTFIILLLGFSIWPIAQYYLNKIPFDGIDIYLSASYVNHLINYFAFRFNGWKDFWFSGVSYAMDYPSLYFYMMVPFSKVFGLIAGIQRFAIAGLAVSTVFYYLLYRTLSKNRLLAILLTLGTIYSANLYKSLVTAGGIPFWTTQAFLPIILFFIVKFCQSENRKWFFLAALISGIGINGHPQSYFNVIFPTVFILLFFWRPIINSFSILKRLGDFTLFGVITYLIGLPFLSSLLPLHNIPALIELVTGIISTFFMREKYPVSSTIQTVGSMSETEKWTQNQFFLIFSDTNLLLWFLAGFAFIVFILILIFRRNRVKNFLYLFPFFLIVGYFIGLIFLLSRGINIIVGGWYKGFWPLMAGLGMFVAALWSELPIKISFENSLRQFKKLIQNAFSVGFNLVFIGLIIYLVIFGSKELLIKLDHIEVISSAFPTVLDVKTADEDLALLKKEFYPKLIVDNPHDYRLYVIDARMNIWWGALQEMPLTRGYVDPPIKRGGLFWLDSVLGPGKEGYESSLITDWGVPPEVADKNLHYLVDWYATKYLEGNQDSYTKSQFNSRLASNSVDPQFIDADEEIISQGEVPYGHAPEDLWLTEGWEKLHFYRIKSEIVSPLLMTTNASPILYVGDTEGYDIVDRLLGELNLGPRKIVLAKGPKFIDEVRKEDLKNFSAVFLYRYDYKDSKKVWSMLSDFVQNGGNLFVDTGSDVKESDTGLSYGNNKLPELFPISKTIRKPLDKTWDAESTDQKINAGVDFNQFSPLVFNGETWNISYAPEESNVRSEAQIILKQKGKVIMAEQVFGKGKVIWSGYNLPYHSLKDYNEQEAIFFKNLLEDLVIFSDDAQYGTANWISPRERELEVAEGGIGVVFKEQAFTGWKATFNGQNLKIYKVGPSDPGFMYVRLPKNAAGKIKFTFEGALSSKIYFGVSLLTIILVLDYLLGIKIFVRILKKASSPFQIHTAKWWDKEEDDE